MSPPCDATEFIGKKAMGGSGIHWWQYTYGGWHPRRFLHSRSSGERKTRVQGCRRWATCQWLAARLFWALDWHVAALYTKDGRDRSHLHRSLSRMPWYHLVEKVIAHC